MAQPGATRPDGPAWKSTETLKTDSQRVGQAGLMKPLPANNGSQRTRRSQNEKNIRDQPGQGVARFLPAGPGVVLFVDPYYLFIIGVGGSGAPPTGFESEAREGGAV